MVTRGYAHDIQLTRSGLYGAAGTHTLNAGDMWIGCTNSGEPEDRTSASSLSDLEEMSAPTPYHK